MWVKNTVAYIDVVWLIKLGDSVVCKAALYLWFAFVRFHDITF